MPPEDAACLNPPVSLELSVRFPANVCWVEFTEFSMRPVPFNVKALIVMTVVLLPLNDNDPPLFRVSESPANVALVPPVDPAVGVRIRNALV